jgi:tRNA dimethylallyltransferase
VRRLIRALEVYEHTGRPISALQGRTDVVGAALQIGLSLEREALQRRIDERVDEQIRAGLVDEVHALLRRGVDPALPSMQGLGYKEIIPYLRGEIALAEAIAQLRRNTRRFAKRQYTWFRRDMRIRWLSVDGLSPAAVADALGRMLE